MSAPNPKIITTPEGEFLVRVVGGTILVDHRPDASVSWIPAKYVDGVTVTERKG